MVVEEEEEDPSLPVLFRHSLGFRGWGLRDWGLGLRSRALSGPQP